MMNFLNHIVVKINEISFLFQLALQIDQGILEKVNEKGTIAYTFQKYLFDYSSPWDF